jgi:hypothetical protein
MYYLGYLSFIILSGITLIAFVFSRHREDAFAFFKDRGWNI